MSRGEYLRRWEQLYAWEKQGWTRRAIWEECKARGWRYTRLRVGQILARIARRERNLGE